MTAGTEGFTYYGGNRDFVGDLVSKVLAARELAKSERQIAEKVAEENQTSLEEAGISKGFFFKKALQHEFGGNYITDKKESVKNLFSKRKLLGEILTGKKGGKKISKTARVDAIFDLFKAGNKKSKVDRFLSQYKDIKGRYKAEIDDPMLRPQSPLIPNSRKKIKSATAGAGKRISKEQLFVALTSIVESLNKTAEALGKTTSDVSAGIIRSANSISDIADQIKVRNNTIEDKLDTLINAINNQTQVQKQSADKAKDVLREKKVENIRDVSGTEAFDDLTTPQDETQNVQPTTQITNIQNVIPAATSAQKIEQQQIDAYSNELPQAEKGGIFSGPDSGYNVRLHGDEVVVPLDNNYTQGQPSAVDGVKRPKPRYERGTSGVTNNYSSVGGKFGFGITNMMGIAKGGTTQSSALAQPLVDAMSLPMMAAGGSILAATSKYINSMGGESGKIKPDLDRVTRPIADVFGVPPSIVSKTKSNVKTAGTTKDTEQGKDKKSKSDIIAKMSEGFAKFLEEMSEKINESDGTTTPISPGGGAAANAMELIAGGEGGYNSINRGTAGDTPGGAKSVFGKNLTEMSVGEVMDAQASGRVFAAGKYQIIPDTMKGFVSKMGISREDKFDEATQEKFKDYVSQHKRPIVGQFISGKVGENKIDDVVMELAREFASVGVPYDTTGHRGQKIKKGQSYYSGVGGNAASINPDTLKAKLLQDRQQFLASKNQPPPASPSANKPRTLGQQITQNYGMQTHERFNFKYNNKNYNAYKTATGFDFYEGSRKVTDPSEEQGVIDAFIKERQKVISPPVARQITTGTEDRASLNNGISKPTSFDTASAIRPTSSDNAANNLTAFVAMPEVTPKNASTTGLPNAEDATIGQGTPDSGIRNAFLSTPIA